MRLEGEEENGGFRFICGVRFKGPVEVEVISCWP